MPKVLEYPGSPPRNRFVFYEPEPVRGGAYRLQWPRYRNLVAISDKTGCLRGGEFSPHPFWQSWQLTQTRNDATRLRVAEVSRSWAQSWAQSCGPQVDLHSRVELTPLFLKTFNHTLDSHEEAIPT